MVARVPPHPGILTIAGRLMKVSIRTTSLSLVLRWAQRILFAGAISMLGYCGLVMLDIWRFQYPERRILEHRVREERKAAGSMAAPVSLHSVAPLIGPEHVIGRIDVPRLSVSVIVMEGTDTPALRHAAGHIVGTGLPGEPGNVGIAGHRDTFFRPLRNIQRDDVITLTTLRGEYRYRVVSIHVVSPQDIGVLHPDRNEILTLITCYPFYFVGSAPCRFVVRAERVHDLTREAS